MAKKVTAIVKLQLPAGKATPAPPVGPALGQHGVNIATMQLYRSAAGGYAVMVLECDEPIPDEIAGELRILPGIVKVTILNL